MPSLVINNIQFSIIFKMYVPFPPTPAYVWELAACSLKRMANFSISLPRAFIPPLLSPSTPTLLGWLLDPLGIATRKWGVKGSRRDFTWLIMLLSSVSLFRASSFQVFFCLFLVFWFFFFFALKNLQIKKVTAWTSDSGYMAGVRLRLCRGLVTL